MFGSPAFGRASSRWWPRGMGRGRTGRRSAPGFSRCRRRDDGGWCGGRGLLRRTRRRWRRLARWLQIGTGRIVAFPLMARMTIGRARVGWGRPRTGLDAAPYRTVGWLRGRPLPGAAALLDRPVAAGFGQGA